jgi:hypothetical protein
VSVAVPVSSATLRADAIFDAGDEVDLRQEKA